MKLRYAAILFIALTTIPSTAFAQTVDFGGSGEEFKGRGDRTPPRCQMNVPAAAQGPFFITWNCTDNDADPAEIRSELWIVRNGAPAPQLIGNFLGFPASTFIDESILQVQNFTSGLPVSFRLVARDRAGIATLSPLRTVLSQDTSIDNCDLSVVTEGTESDGTTTGVPALTVTVDNGSVVSQQLSDTDTRIFTASQVPALPCEIDSLCQDGDQLTLDLSVTVTDSGDATGTLFLNPGNIALTISGSVTVSNALLDSVSVSGSTVIDDVAAEVTLTCSD